MLNPGDLVVFAFPGAHNDKRRPAVVISASLYQQCRPDAIVGLLTSQVHKATTPMDYTLQDWQQAGLRQPSTFRCYLVTTDQRDLNAVGKLSDKDWRKVQLRLEHALATT
jgi:mRNA-degrading endonuclease toxin of MazEF toxin-antitoxin module